MRVILLKDIENLGKKNEIKEVAAGYARNFLIPKGLVQLATAENMEWLESKKQEEAEKAEEELKKTQEMVSKIDGLEIVFPKKITKAGKVFGSITAGKIADKLEAKGFNIKKSQINLEDPIKDVSECPVKISFPHGLEAEIRVIVEQKP